MIRYKRLTVAMALLPFGMPAYAADADAPEPAKENVLESIKITGNWLGSPTEQKLLEHPGARTIVERKEFEERGAMNVRDALRGIPGVQVQDSNGTGGSDISLNVGVRGLTARLSPRSTILMDGIPLAYAPYGQPQLSLAPLSLGNLEMVDVVRGAGSVRYGPQNVGGIINFVTRPIPEQFTANAAVGTEIYSHGGDVKTMPSAFIGGTNAKGLGGAILYSGTHGNGYRESNDRIDIDDVILKGAYKFTVNDDIAVSLHHFEGQGRMPGGLTTQQYADDPFQSTRPYDDYTGRRTDGSIKYTHKDALNSFELLAYYTDSFRGSHIEQEGSGATAGLRRLTSAPRGYHTLAIEPRYSRLIDMGSIVQEISVGYRFLNEASSETAARTAYYDPNSGIDARTLASQAYQTSQGGTTANAFYIDDRIDIGRWTITPGVRYEIIRTFNNVTNLSNGAVTSALYPKIDSHVALPMLSVLYRVQDNWSLFANVGQSFGPEQYSQLASTTQGLHPEKATTYELGTRFNGPTWGGELTLFNIDFDQELQLSRSIVGDGIWTDLGATRHRGVESAVHYDIGSLVPALNGLSVYATYTYTQAIAKAGVFAGRDLPLYSRQVATLGATYRRNQWTFNADLFAQTKQHSPGDPNAGATYVTQEDPTGRLGDIPGYATVNLRAAYHFGKELNNLDVAVGVKNLLDRRYFTRSTDNNGGKYVGQPLTVYMQASLSY
ncbi:TonB-dependent siderophore receptor [Paraburkholderia sp. Ac-20342]|nr:TonB-dependent siderophore receptor [Paraburkholderia sp. Ac-20342]